MNKLKPVITSFLILSLSLIFALNVFDDIVYNIFFGNDSDSYSVVFKKENFDLEDFETIKSSFKQHDLGLYMNDYKTDVFTIYAYNLDEEYVSNMPLKGQISSLLDFGVIDSYHNKIIKSFKTNYEIRPFNSLNDFNLDYIFNIRTYNKNIENELNLIKNQLSLVNIEMEYTLENKAVENKANYFDFSENIFFISMFFIGLIIALDLLNRSDYIAKLKIEGYGIIKIFFKSSLLELLILIGNSLFFAVIITFFLTYDLLSWFLVLFVPLIIRILIYCLIILITYILVFILAYNNKIIDVLKGRLYTKQSTFILIIVKVMLIVVCLAFFTQNTLSLFSYVKSELTYQDKVAFLDDYYLANIYTSISITDKIDYEKLYQDVKNDARVKYLIDFNKNVILDKNSLHEFYYYTINDDYLLINDLPIPSKSTIYLPKDKYDKKTILKISYQASISDYQIIEYENDLYQFSNSLYQSPLKTNELFLVYDINKEYKYSIPSIVKCDGDYNEVLKKAFLKQDLSQKIYSQEIIRDLIIERNVYISNIVIPALIFNVAICLSYILLSKQINAMELALNSKLYLLEVMEGRRFLSHLKIKIIELTIVFFLSNLVLLFKGSKSYFVSFLFLVILIVLEFISVIIFNHNFLKKIMKGEVYENRN